MRTTFELLYQDKFRASLAEKPSFQAFLFRITKTVRTELAATETHICTKQHVAINNKYVTITVSKS